MFKQAILPENYTIRSNQIQHVRYGARSVDVSISSQDYPAFCFFSFGTVQQYIQYKFELSTKKIQFPFLSAEQYTILL